MDVSWGVSVWPRESRIATRPSQRANSDDNANSDQPAGCSCSPFRALGCAPWQSFTATGPRLVDPSGPVADPDGPRWAKVYYHVCTLVFPAAIYRTRKDAWLKQRPWIDHSCIAMWSGMKGSFIAWPSEGPSYYGDPGPYCWSLLPVQSPLLMSSCADVADCTGTSQRLDTSQS